VKPSPGPQPAKGLWPALCYSPQPGAETKKAEAEQKDKLKMRKKALLTRGDYIKKPRQPLMPLSANATRVNHAHHAALITHL
jgi:hypothetical protein